MVNQVQVNSLVIGYSFKYTDNKGNNQRHSIDVVNT